MDSYTINIIIINCSSKCIVGWTVVVGCKLSCVLLQQAYDEDGSNSLSQDEYRSMTRESAPSFIGYSGLLFNLFDANRDQILDHVDMLGLFNTMDSDSDSLVNRIEMIRWAD